MKITWLGRFSSKLLKLDYVSSPYNVFRDEKNKAILKGVKFQFVGATHNCINHQEEVKENSRYFLFYVQNKAEEMKRRLYGTRG